MEKGKIISISEVQVNKTFEWRDIIVEVAEEKWTKAIALKTNKFSITYVDKLNVGDEVHIVYPGEMAPSGGKSLCVVPQSRSYNEKWYNDIVLNRINA